MYKEEILELREFRIHIVFDSQTSCNYYNPRLILNSPLNPGETISINNLDGNKSIGYGNRSKEEINSIIKNYPSQSYDNQTYKIIYKN